MLGTGIGKDFNIENLRYKGGIFLVADSDSDGEHIKSLLLTFFITHLPELILNGYVYVSYPPLYSITERGKKTFFLSDEQYTHFIAERAVKKLNEDEDLDIQTNLTFDELENTIGKLMDYEEKLDKISNKYSSKSMFEAVLIEATIQLMGNGEINFNSMSGKKTLESLNFNSESPTNDSFQYIQVEDIEGGTQAMSGFFRDEYQFIPLNDEFLGDLTDMMEYMDVMFNEDNTAVAFTTSDGTPILNPSVISQIIQKVTPKHRTRYKGLGENNADELEETVMNPDTRLVRQVTISDLEEAIEQTDKLFNSKRTDDRKEFVDSNTQFARENEIVL